MMKKLACLAAACVLAVSVAGCNAPQDQGPDYADDEAMQVISDGYAKRSDVIEKQDAPESNADVKDNYREAVEVELNVEKSLKDRQFEDGKLQEKVIAYINTLEDSLKVLDSMSVDDFEFYEAWGEVFDERTSLLKDFVDDYGLTVPERCQDSFSELIANGKAAKSRKEQTDAIEGLIKAVEWEIEDDGYGSYTYSAVVENTSAFDFEDVSITLALYDADGVRAEETYVSTKSWKKGEKVRFETMSDVNAARVEAAVDYFKTSK